MTARAMAGQIPRQKPSIESDVAAALSQAFGPAEPVYESLDSAFHDGVKTIIAEMKAGNLSESQAAGLIDSFVTAYAAATVNQQINALFQDWAAGLTFAGAGGRNGLGSGFGIGKLTNRRSP